MSTYILIRVIILCLFEIYMKWLIVEQIIHWTLPSDQIKQVLYLMNQNHLVGPPEALVENPDANEI